MENVGPETINLSERSEWRLKTHSIVATERSCVCFRCTQTVLSRKAGDILLVWLTPKIRRGAGRMDLRLADNDKISHKGKRTALQCCSFTFIV